MDNGFTWTELIEHLTSWKRRDFRSDPDRDAHRLENLEWVLRTALEKLRDANPEL